MQRSLQAADRGPDPLSRHVPVQSIKGRLSLVPPQKGKPATASPRVLLYSHDTFGLGNIRRTLLLAHEVTDVYPTASVLILTGSPVIHSFRIPRRVDYIKLPCLDRTSAEKYEPLFLGGSEKEVGATRRAILRESTLGFDPDLIIVDKRPAGIGGELLETLEALRDASHRARLVLGMRDILDDPERTIPSLSRAGAFDTIRRFYDEVWIYGVASVFDTVSEYRFPAAVAERARYCGYLRRPTAPQGARDDPTPRVLVTTGGGADGFAIIEAYLEGISGLPRRTALQSIVVLGPQLDTGLRDDLLARFGHMRDVEFVDFEPDMASRYADADVVVSMAGYNTVCELLSFGRRAVLVPRCRPVREQSIRAERIASLDQFDVIDPDRLDPEELTATVLDACRRPPPVPTTVDLGGLPRIRDRVAALLSPEEGQ